MLVRADAELLRKCLSILVENALSKLPAGSNIWFESYEKDGQLCVEVSDNGIGFTPDLLERLSRLVKQEKFLVEEEEGLSWRQ